MKKLENKLVSIIMPAYNEESRISRMIESLINQTYKKIEIIIIDDGSKDNTYNICKNYQEKDSRIRLYHQENSGSDVARKLGISEAKGYYIMFADSDDYYDVRAVELVVNEMKIKELDILNYNAVCVYDDINENESGINNDRYIKKNEYNNIYTGPEYFRELLNKGDFSCVFWSYAFKANIIKNNDMTLLSLKGSQNADTGIAVELLYHAKRVAFLKETLYYRTVHTNSVMTRAKNLKYLYYIYYVYSYLESKNFNDESVMGYIYILKDHCNQLFKTINKDNINEELKEFTDTNFIEFINNKLLEIETEEKKENIKFNNKDKISIVIPTYNRATLIERAINSVLKQTCENIEVIVVDDASTDNTESIVKNIKDKRVKYIKLRKNSGACAARNTGIKKATGKYISFNDSDDEYLPEKLEKQYKNLIKNKSDMDFCKIDIHTKDFELAIPVDPSLENIKKKKYMDELVIGNFISTQAILIKKDIITKYMFDEELPRLQDYDLVLRIVPDVKLSYTDEILVNLYNTENSISNSNTKLLNAVKIMVNKKYNMTEKQAEIFRNSLIDLYAKNVEKSNSKISELQQSYDNLLNEYQISQGRVEELNGEISKVLNSKSWKVTKPLRFITDKTSKLKRKR